MLPVRFLAVIGLLVAGQSAVLAGPQTVSNTEREKNWADQVVDSVVVGEPVWLKTPAARIVLASDV